MSPEIILLATGIFIIDRGGRIWRRKSLRRAEHRDGKGYLQVRAMVGGKRLHVGAHRLVWVSLHGPIPDGVGINHKNGMKDDNRPINLELATASENLKHAYRHGLMDEHGERNPAHKLTDAQVAQIRLAYANGGFTQTELGCRFGVDFRTISKIVNRREADMAGMVTRESGGNESAALEWVCYRFYRLAAARLQAKLKAGYTGWDDPAAVPDQKLVDRLRLNVARGDWADVGALAALLWNRAQRGT